MSAVATGLHMALLHAKMDVEVGTVAPELGTVEQAHAQFMAQSPPPRMPHRWGVGADFGGEEQSS